MKYEDNARQALEHGLQPISPEATCDHWKALGVTRQTAHRWRSSPDLVPVAARLAAAWLIVQGNA